MANNQIPKWQQQLRAQKEAEEQKKQQQKRKKTLIGICAGAVAVIAVVLLSVLLAPKPEAPVETEPVEKTVDMKAVVAAIDSMQVSDFSETQEQTEYVKLTVENYGELVVRLCPEAAPLTVENFKGLVSQHFYDGLTFHRIYPGFMIQGGDPKGDGTGDSGTNIKGEFSANGIQNDLTHVRGVISMARGSYSMDSASCQFFICHADARQSLDGLYAAFGYVVAGLSTVDAICEVELKPNAGGELSSPVTPVNITSVAFVTPKQ